MPPTRATVSRTTSRPTPRPETSVTLLVVVKPGRNMNSSNSASLIRPAISAVAWRRLDDGLANALDVDAAAVIGHRDGQHAGSMTHLDAYDAFRGLAGGGTSVGHLQPVIDGVAQQVRQRRFELFQDVAIHFC